MNPNPTRNQKRLEKIVTAWSTLSPTKSFGGMTLEQFKTAIKPSLDARAAKAEADEKSAAAMVQRDDADKASFRSVEKVVAGVVADDDNGSDGELYRAMGYVRKSERASGLTRKGVQANAAQASQLVTKTA